MGETIQRGGKSYWRSLERLLDSPAAALPPSPDEFPPGSSLPPGEMSRRTMMGLMGASFALTGLTGCRRPVETIVPYVNAPEGIVPGIPRHYATVMPLGAAAWGVVAESHEGRPTKLEGNALHPASGGAANAWMQAAVLGLYDPDRSPRPLRRAAAAGGGATPGAEAAQAPAGTQAATWADFVKRWQEIAAGAAADGGAGLAVLSAGSTSPTLARLAAAFRARYPRARWTSWEPVHEEAAFRGLELATGQALRPVHHLERAAVVVALDADLLHTKSDALACARGFAAGRRRGADGGAGGEMNRLYAVESTLSITGASADHRLRLPSRQIGAFTLALAGELARRGLPLAAPPAGADGDLPPAVRAKVAAIAADLAAHRGAAPGGRRPPAAGRGARRRPRRQRGAGRRRRRRRTAHPPPADRRRPRRRERAGRPRRGDAGRRGDDAGGAGRQPGLRPRPPISTSPRRSPPCRRRSTSGVTSTRPRTPPPGISPRPTSSRRGETPAPPTAR